MQLETSDMDAFSSCDGFNKHHIGTLRCRQRGGIHAINKAVADTHPPRGFVDFTLHGTPWPSCARNFWIAETAPKHVSGHIPLHRLRYLPGQFGQRAAQRIGGGRRAGSGNRRHDIEAPHELANGSFR